MPTKRRRVVQTVTELVLLLAIAGLCSLALSGESPTWIRRPTLTENLADTPRLHQCMIDVVAKAGHGKPPLRFSGPFLTQDRQTAWYFVHLGSDSPYRLDFVATTGQKWRLFQYGGDFDTKLGAFSGRMDSHAQLIDRKTGKALEELDLLPCASFLGQGVGHGA
jgi:hypothetical protein